MYNPYPPVAGTAAGTLAVTGGSTTGIVVAAFAAILVGLILLRTRRVRTQKTAAHGE